MATYPYIWRADDTIEIKARARSGNKVSSLLGKHGWLYLSSTQPSLPHFTTNRDVQYLPRNKVCDFDGMEVIVLRRARVVGTEYNTSETGMEAYLYCKIEEDD